MVMVVMVMVVMVMVVMVMVVAVALVDNGSIVVADTILLAMIGCSISGITLSVDRADP